MPTYEYACTACGQHLEVHQRLTDDPLTTCGSCGGALRKVFHPAGIVFKGSGFYATDSRSGSKSTSASPSSAPEAAASATATSDGGSSSGGEGPAATGERGGAAAATATPAPTPKAKPTTSAPSKATP